MKTVTGVFPSQVEAERAVSELSRLGLDEGSIRTVRRGDIEGDGLFSAFANALSSGDNATVGTLNQMGLSDEEAEFYDRELGPDGVLMIVNAPEEHHDEVLRIMRNAEGVSRDASR